MTVQNICDVSFGYWFEVVEFPSTGKIYTRFYYDNVPMRLSDLKVYQMDIKNVDGVVYIQLIV